MEVATANAVDDLLEGSFMQLHSLSAEYLNGHIVEIGSKDVDSQGITRYVCVAIPSESNNKLENENKIKIKLANLRQIPKIGSEDELVELRKKLSKLESKYIFAENDPKIASIRSNKNLATKGYQKIAEVYASHKYISRIWFLKASMALVFKSGPERQNIYLQCIRRAVANLQNDISLTEEERKSRMLPALKSYLRMTQEFRRPDETEYVLKISVANFPDHDSITHMYGMILYHNEKFFEAGPILCKLYCKKEFNNITDVQLPTVGRPPTSLLAQSTALRSEILGILNGISFFICKLAKEVEAEGDRLTFDGQVVAGKALYSEACDMYFQAAKCAPDDESANECWFYAQIKKQPSIVVLKSPTHAVTYGHLDPFNNELVVYSFVNLRAAGNMCTQYDNFRFIILGLPEGWGGV